MSAAVSLDYTVLTSADDPPIVDSYGRVWRLTDTRQLITEGVLDDTPDLQAVVYCNQRVWQLLSSGLWRSKDKPTDPWLPPGGSPTSPLGSVELGILAILQMLSQLKLSSTMSMLSELQASVQSLQQTVAASDSYLDAQLKLVLAAIAKITSPGHIELDLAHTSHTSQPIPAAKGP